MSDITETRIMSNARRVLRELDAVYTRMPKIKPDFWERWEAAEAVAHQKLGKRPLSLSEIERACNDFRKVMLGAM